MHRRPHRARFLCTSCNVEPFFVQIFRRFRPMKSCRVPKEIKEICDGNPAATTTSEPFEYISNQALEEALIEEMQNGPNVSLAAISSCLSQHVDPNISDSSSSSSSSNRPLHYAAKYGNSKLTALLLDAGANIDKVNALGQTPLMIACQFISRHHFACAELLISRACNMELRDKGGSNALEQAITASNVACVKFLLGNGCQLSCALGDRGPDISSRSTLFEQPDESSILALAESVRARSVGMEILVDDANALFAELEASGGPSILDRIRRSRLCSSSHLVVGVVKDHCSPLSLKVQSAAPRRSKRIEKHELGFVGRVQVFLQKSIARKGTLRRKSSKHEKKSRQRQIRSKKKWPSHERKAQSHEIDDEHKEEDLRSYSRKTDDVRRRKKEKDSRSRKKRTQRRTRNEHRSSDTTSSNLSASRAARSSRRPNERHRRRRKDDRIRRKRQSAMRLNRNGEDVVQY